VTKDLRPAPEAVGVQKLALNQLIGSDRFIVNIIARRIKSHKDIFSALMPIAEQRVHKRDQANLGQDVPKHVSPGQIYNS
jgi:hypothetical protein